jgi:predicted anti-sigma-YlaC factor YlaD
MNFLDKIKDALHGHLKDEELLDYSLDGLEGVERDKAEEHLADCQRCREQLREYMGFAEAMALSVPQVDPPEGFKEQTLKKLADMQRGGL